MRLISVFMIIFVVSAVWTVSLAKQSKPAQSSPHSLKHTSADQAKKPHQELDHRSDNHDHTKTLQNHNSKQEGAPRSSKKKSEQKHNKHNQEGKTKVVTHGPVQVPKLVQDGKKKHTNKKPEHKNKHRHEGKRQTTALPVVIHRKLPGGTNVTNNGTSGVGYIINAPLISCPEGQRRVKGECKGVFG